MTCWCKGKARSDKVCSWVWHLCFLIFRCKISDCKWFRRMKKTHKDLKETLSWFCQKQPIYWMLKYRVFLKFPNKIMKYYTSHWNRWQHCSCKVSLKKKNWLLILKKWEISKSTTKSAILALSFLLAKMKKKVTWPMVATSPLLLVF